MTKEEIKAQVEALLALPISDDIKEQVSEGITNIIDTAIQDKYDEMKEYVDSKINEIEG